MLTRSASRSTLRCLEMVGWLAASSSTSSPTALSPDWRDTRMSRRVASAMTANTSSVTMRPTLATYTSNGIYYFADGWPHEVLVEPGVQAVQREDFLARGHHGAVDVVVGIEAHLPGPPPDVGVVAHGLRRVHAVALPHIRPPRLRHRGAERHRAVRGDADQ